MLRLVTRLLVVSLLGGTGLAQRSAFADDPDENIPAPLTEDDLASPLGDDQIPGAEAPHVLQPPVPIPAPHDVRPPVPIPAPHEVHPPIPAPRPEDIDPPVPMPSPHEVRLPSPWALPDALKQKWAAALRRWAGWGVSCRTERHGKQREIRCRLAEPKASSARLPATAQAQRGASCGNGEEARLFALLNAARRAQGLAPLACSARAVAVARGHSQDMCSRRFFGHFSPEGANPGQRLRRGGIGHRAAGENIARGHNTADGAHAGWIGSPAHRRTMMRPEYTHVGIGLVECDSTGPYWTAVFFKR